MSEQNSNIKDTAEIVQSLVENVPIYEDMLQPASKELGKSFKTVAQVINVALFPLKGLVWGYEQIADFLEHRLAEKMQSVPKENITTPDPSIAVPATEALRYNAHKEELREMFTNLIATAMDKKTTKFAHPSFVEILKQISPDEAKIFESFTDHMSRAVIKLRSYNQEDDHYTDILQEFSVLPYKVDCENPELGPSYINNLVRLGLLSITYTAYSTLENSYEPIYDHEVYKNSLELIDNAGKRAEVKRGTLVRTKFGENFYRACIAEE